MSSSVSLEYLNSVIPVVVPTSQAVSAQNTTGASIAVILAGTPVPLPTQPYMNGFTVNGANTEFTVTNSGNYLISYNMKTTAALLLSSSVYKNGTAIPNLTQASGLSLNAFSGSAIVPLVAGDKLILTLFGLLGAAVLSGGAGATMNIVRIS